MGNGEAKELTCTTMDVNSGGGMMVGWGAGQRGIKGRKNGTTVIAQSIKYVFLKKEVKVHT